MQECDSNLSKKVKYNDFGFKMNTNNTCMELALEGERLCKSGDCRAGVAFFEAAIQSGTDDLKTLSAIYSQLGNAYFYLGEYGKAMQFHKHDLALARTLGDKLGEAKASGNLGNTLKVLGKFDEAILCCQRHLEISKELGDKIGEGRALYNLGNVYHAKGKHSGRIGHQDPGEFPEEIRECLQMAARYYETNLIVMKDLGDRAAQGRACGNLGNTHYLLGDFQEAILYHQERLTIAQEFGDKVAERRAYSNLGNAHVFLGEFEVAAEHYQRTLQIAQDLGELAVEAQACYSLGNTFTLIRDYEKAIEYHMRHLQIAQQLKDRVGEGRACWSLGNAHTALGNHQQALQFANKHLEISKEIGDKSGQATAKMNLADLCTVLGIQRSTSTAESDNSSISTSSLASRDASDTSDSGKVRARRISMEQMNLLAFSPDPKFQSKQIKVQKSNSHASFENLRKRSDGSLSANSQASIHSLEHVSIQVTRIGHSQTQARTLKKSTDRDAVMDDESFFELLSRFQSKRMDDQRCSVNIMENKENQVSSGNKVKAQHSNKVIRSTSVTVTRGKYKESNRGQKNKDDLMDLIAGMQSKRMNDQRASFPGVPVHHNSQGIIGQLLHNETASVPDDHFFDMLMRCQSTRIDDQRVSLPDPSKAPTVPDEDFYNLIVRLQAGRLEDQRSVMPTPRSSSLSSAMPSAMPALPTKKTRIPHAKTKH